jgi:hypothetical protein
MRHPFRRAYRIRAHYNTAEGKSACANQHRNAKAARQRLAAKLLGKFEEIDFLLITINVMARRHHGEFRSISMDSKWKAAKEASLHVVMMRSFQTFVNFMFYEIMVKIAVVSSRCRMREKRHGGIPLSLPVF